jgi:tripartite-type tricarboxylate transporter receptor subunit TctC
MVDRPSRTAMTIFLRALLALLFALAAAASGAQTYPSRPLKLVVPFPPGQGADTLMRLVGERLSASMSQPVIVENRPGAGGTIGTEYVKTQPADGYTLLMGASGPMAISPSLQPAVVKYQPLKDFEPVTGVASVAQAFAVNPESDIHSVQDLVKQAKARPGQVSYGSSGNGTTQHLFVEEFAAMAGIKLLHVPYKGSGPALTDLMGNRLGFVSDTITALLPQIKAGKLRAIGVTSATRSPFLPDVPTIAEQGVKGYSAEGWITVLAPAGTPPAIADRLNAEIRKALADPDLHRKLSELGFVEMNVSRAALREFMAAEIAKWKKVIDEAGVKVD